MVRAADHAEQRALAETEAFEHLGPLDRVGDGRGLGLELDAHPDHLDVVARRCELVAHTLLDLGDVSRSFSPTLTTARCACAQVNARAPKHAAVPIWRCFFALMRTILLNL